LYARRTIDGARSTPSCAKRRADSFYDVHTKRLSRRDIYDRQSEFALRIIRYSTISEPGNRYVYSARACLRPLFRTSFARKTALDARRKAVTLREYFDSDLLKRRSILAVEAQFKRSVRTHVVRRVVSDELQTPRSTVSGTYSLTAVRRDRFIGRRDYTKVSFWRESPSRCCCTTRA